METKVSDTWLKFWNELMEDCYGETKNKYLPAELMRRRMAKYEIKEIKTNVNKELPNPETKSIH
jgi:hypothetical protein